MKQSLIVLIATAGENNLLAKTLESLSNCVLPASYTKTIVVENGRKYYAEQITNSYVNSLKTQYLYNATANKSAALNYAMENLEDTTLIFFTDDDVLFDKKLLLAYDRHANLHSQGHFFGGPTIPNYEHQPPKWLIPSLPPSAKGFSFKDPFIDSMFLGFNWAAFSRDIKKMGGFNPKFGPGTVPKRTGQETDMQKRLLEGGLSPIFILEAKVWHFVPSKNLNLRWLIKRKYEGGRGKGLRQALYSNKKNLPLRLIHELVLALFDLVLSLFSGKEKKVLMLCRLISSIGKVRGYFMR